MDIMLWFAVYISVAMRLKEVGTLWVQDEETCIGCTMCASIAPATFRMEKEYGRSRVYAQWANNDNDTEVICCLDCITHLFLAIVSVFPTVWMGSG